MTKRGTIAVALTVMLATLAVTGIMRRAEGGGGPPVNPLGVLHTLAPGNAALLPGNVTAATIRGVGQRASDEYTRLWRDEVLKSIQDVDVPAISSLINAGEPVTQYPAVGLLLEVIHGHDPVPRCTGTLVDSDTFLTAAHCVVRRDTSRYLVYLQHVGVIAVIEDGITTYCDERDC